MGQPGRVAGTSHVMASYGIISLSKKLTHNCFSRLRSINKYLVIDWGGHGRWRGSKDLV